MQGMLKKKKSVKVRLFKSEILGSGSDTVVRIKNTLMLLDAKIFVAT